MFSAKTAFDKSLGLVKLALVLMVGTTDFHCSSGRSHSVGEDGLPRGLGACLGL